HQLLGQVDVGVLQGAGVDLAELGDACGADQGGAGVDGRGPGGATDVLQPFRIDEAGQHDLALLLALTVAVVDEHVALAVDADTGLFAGGVARSQVGGNAKISAVLAGAGVVDGDIQGSGSRWSYTAQCYSPTSIQTSVRIKGYRLRSRSHRSSVKVVMSFP